MKMQVNKFYKNHSNIINLNLIKYKIILNKKIALEISRANLRL